MVIFMTPVSYLSTFKAAHLLMIKAQCILAARKSVFYPSYFNVNGNPKP